MKNVLIITMSVIFVWAIASCPSNAQVPVGKLGISASFSSSKDMAGIVFATSPHLLWGLGVGYSTTSYSTDRNHVDEPETESVIMFELYGRIYLYKGKDVHPFVGLGLGYSMFPDEPYNGSKDLSGSMYNFDLFFGGETFISSSFSVWAQVGLHYDSYTPNEDDTYHSYNLTHIRLFTAGVGASLFL